MIAPPPKGADELARDDCHPRRQRRGQCRPALTAHVEVPGLARGDLSDQPRVLSHCSAGDGLFGRVGRSEDHTKHHHRDDDERGDRADGEGEEGSGSIDGGALGGIGP